MNNITKKFFEVNVGVEELNNSLYEYIVSNMQILNVEAVETVSDEIKAKIQGKFNLPTEMVQIFRLKTLDGKVFFIAATLYTKVVDKTYIEFQEWLENEGLTEDLDMEYDQYLAENNIEIDEVEKVYYSFSNYDLGILISEKENKINSIKNAMKIVPILELELENLRMLTE